VVLEAVADEPEHRPPQADEERAPLGVAALVVGNGLAADPEPDAQADRRERSDVQASAAEARPAQELGEHG